jgi:hypothetical protein
LTGRLFLRRTTIDGNERPLIIDGFSQQTLEIERECLQQTGVTMSRNSHQSNL